MKLSTTNVQIDRLVRSKRRSISLEIERDGSLTVRAPKHASHDEIISLVNGKKEWISRKQALTRERLQEAPPKQFLEGERFLYLGKTFPLEIVPDQPAALLLNGTFQLAAEQQDSGRIIFEQWYREHAAQVIKPRTATMAEQHGFTYTIIRITGAKTRWGSCGPKGSLNFSWRLVMAPVEVIDYVILHELAHLRIRNHSKRYWQEVRGIMPDYKDHIKWLHENGHRLRLD